MASAVNQTMANAGTLINLPAAESQTDQIYAQSQMLTQPVSDQTPQTGITSNVLTPCSLVSATNITPSNATIITSSSSINITPSISMNCVSAADNLGMHVSQTNKEKIVMGQYIDLASLLQNANVVEASMPQKITMINGELVVQQQKQYQKITSIEKWTDAFIVYMSIYCGAHPDKYQNILKYMNTIRLGAKRCGNTNFGWKQYDEQFRLKIAQNPTNNWAEIDLELWLLYINSSNVYNQNVSTRQAYKCYAYNYNGYCDRNNCTYSHCCMNCFGGHPLLSCTRQGTVQLEPRVPSQFARPRSEFRPRGYSSSNFRYPQTSARPRYQRPALGQGQYTSKN